MKFLTILFLFFSCWFKTNFAEVLFHKVTMCVLSEPMQRSRPPHPQYAQIDIVVCQPDEVCAPISHEVNIGTYGLG